MINDTKIALIQYTVL